MSQPCAKSLGVSGLMAEEECKDILLRSAMNADYLSYHHTRESEKGTGGPGQESQRIRAAPPDWLRGQSGSWTTLLI